MRSLFPLVLVACSHAADPYLDARLPLDAPPDAVADAPPMGSGGLVLNEVGAGDTPDWFEIVNTTNAPIALAQFCYVDVAGDFAKCKPFAAGVTLSPGAYLAQDVDDVLSGFKLASDEELWIYRIADQQLVDGVDWLVDASPTGASYRRIPDRTGAFATGAQSKGAPNP